MAELASTTFSQVDGSNTSSPGLSGSSAPSEIDDSIRGIMGALKREHDWRNFTVTSGGSLNAYTLTYSVAPSAYYTGSRFGFITNFSNTGAATVNVNTLGAKTVKKLVAGSLTDLSSGDFASGDYVDLVYNGTYMVWVNKGQATTVSSATDTSQGIVELATTTETLTGTDTARAVTPDALASLWEKGSDIASAGTLTIGEGEYFHVTGTTAITDIDFSVAKDGRKAILVFDGALTLTHNATTLILPGGASITTAAGDSCMVVQDASDNVKVVWYQKADGSSIAQSGGYTLLGTLTTTSGSSQALTGLTLTGYKKLEIFILGVSGSGTSGLLLGQTTADDVQCTGPLSSSPDTFNGKIDVELTNGMALFFGNLSNVSGANIASYMSYPPITTASTGISFAPATGTFDAGSIKIYGVK